jgi:hypothetical protein
MECSELTGGLPVQRVRFGASLAVGRHPGNGLRIDEPSASNFHAVIEWVDGGWWVRDLGSRNGTTLNGRRLSAWARLGEGDVLRFARGSAWCVARLVAPVPEVPSGGIARTLGVLRAPPADLSLDLISMGPARGFIAVRWDQAELQRELGGNPFLLLYRLARSAGQWVTDAELRRCLWGKRGEDLTRSALHTPIYKLRGMFAAWGLEGSLIEKDQGATRLNLEPSQVRCGGPMPTEGLASEE